MSRKSDYIPKGDFHLLDWSKAFSAYAEASHERWGVLCPCETFNPLIADFETKLQKAKSSNSGAVDVKAKNMAKEKLVKEIRVYVQGYVARNPRVTEEDKVAVQLPVYDTTPTNIPPPTSPVEGILAFPATGLVEMRDIRPAGEKTDAKAGYGVRIYYGIMGTPSETNRFRITERPRTGDDLPHSIFTRKKRQLFDFTGENGKEVFFCMRYENSKGEAGPWGKIISAFIP